MDPNAAFAFVRRLIVPLLGLLFCTPAVAPADTVPYRHFTVHDGLPNESVTALTQGPHGRLWIGTTSGLAVYDGHSIRQVSLPDSVTPGPVTDLLARPSGTVCAALESASLVCFRRGTVERVVPIPDGPNSPVQLFARKDTLLAVTRKELWILPSSEAPVTKRAYDYPIRTGALATLDASTGLGITDATLAPDGTIWVLDERHGLGKLSIDGSVAFLTSRSAQSNRERWMSVRSLEEQKVILSRETENYRVDLSSGRRTPLSRPGYIEIRRSETGFYGLHLDRVVHRTSTDTVSYGTELGLPKAVYRTVLEDEEGGLWIGTENGLLYLPAPRARHAKWIDGQSLRWMGPFGVDSTRQELWVSSWGGGLFRLRPNPTHRSPRSNATWTMAVDGRDGALHALSRNGWFRRGADGWVPVNLSLSAVHGVVRPTGVGYFWTDDGLVRLRPQREAVPDTLWHWPRADRGYYAFTLVPEGDLFLRSRGAILRMPPNAPDRADTLVSIPDYRSAGTPSMVVKNGALWMSLEEHGLLRVGLRAAEPRVSRVLSSAGAWHLSPGTDSLLFAETQDGLCALDTRTTRVRRCLTQADGLASRSGKYARFYRDTLYVSHEDGLSKLPRSILADVPSPPTPLISRWNVNDTTRSLTDSVRLAASERTIRFDFTGVQLARGTNVRYAYRLLPRDTSWTKTKQSLTRYTSLSPGTYRFQVRARLANGPAQSPAQLTFTIPKLYYETAWFEGLVAVAGLFLMGGLYLWRFRALQRRQAKLQRMVDERTAQLTEEKKTTEQQAQRLEALDEQKNRFFANISHELRTPLTILQGTLQDAINGTFGEVPPLLQRQLDIMESNLHRLRRLTDQLLDLSRLETAGPELNAKPRDVVGLVRYIVRSFVPLAERRGLDLRITTPLEEHPCRVDPEKLEKILGNLLSNALRNTPEGGEVRVELNVEDSNPPETVLRVTDTGRGIAPERQDEIFERFVHADQEDPDRTGTGIGLSLVREYVELHDGSIALDSSPQEGSTFTVRLPLPPAASTAAASAERTADEEPAAASAPMISDDASASPSGNGVPDDSEQPTLLVVEDNADVRAYLRRHLANTYHLVEAPSGTDGLAAAREIEPDLVLTDLMMPEMGGIELCQKIRADDDLARTPVLLLTARAAEEDAVAGLEAGADAYVKKPFSMAELRARLRRLLEAHWSSDPAGETDGLLTPDVEVNSADEEFLARVTDIIDANLSRSNFTVEDLAAEVGLSPRQLQRKLKRLTETTAASFIRRYRLDVAAQLLEKEAGTVSEIAYEVGFGTRKTFSARFEEQFGCPPSAYPPSTSDSGSSGSSRTEANAS